MKKILFSLFLASFFSVSYAQEEEFVFPYKYLKLSEGEVLWEKIFIADSLNPAEVEKMLFNYLPTISGIKNVAKLGDVIVFDISNFKVDYKKYGGKPINTVMFLNHPLDAKGFVSIKEGKYRITIKNIIFSTYTPQTGFSKITLEEGITRKKGAAFSQREILVDAGIYIESTFDDLFKKRVVKSDW